MRAAVITAPRKFAIGHYPVPVAAGHEVAVKLEGCGVCGSNLPVWEGRPWFSYPIIPGGPGHEGWGRVAWVGTKVSNLAPGDRVALLSTSAFAEYDVAAEQTVVKLPTELKSIPFPGEALGCAMNVFARADIKPGQRVAVIGIGFLGSLLVSLSTTAGAEVIAISRRAYALDVARSYGASHTIPLEDHHAIIEKVKSITAGEGCERVIEATGYQWPLDLAGELTKERGKLIIAGYHQDGPRQVNMQLWNWRGIDVINAHERDPKVYAEGIRMAAQAVASGKLDYARLLTHRFDLDNINEAFSALSDRPEGFMKAYVAL